MSALPLPRFFSYRLVLLARYAHQLLIHKCLFLAERSELLLILVLQLLSDAVLDRVVLLRANAERGIAEAAGDDLVFAGCSLLRGALGGSHV